MRKIAAHAHDRMRERTELPEELVDTLERNIRKLGLPRGDYYTELRNSSGHLQGYATFRAFGSSNKLHMTTVLSPYMNPSGQKVTVDTPPVAPQGKGTDHAKGRRTGRVHVKAHSRKLKGGKVLKVKEHTRERPPEVVYHGSTAPNISAMEPRPHPLVGGKKVVFATSDKKFAVSMSIPEATDDKIAVGYYTDTKTGKREFYLDELKPGALQVFNKPAYLYTLNSKGFKGDPRLMKSELVSHKPVPVLRKERIDNVLKELQSMPDVFLTRYGDVPTSMGGRAAVKGSHTPDKTDWSKVKNAMSKHRKRPKEKLAEQLPPAPSMPNAQANTQVKSHFRGQKYVKGYSRYQKKSTSKQKAMEYGAVGLTGAAAYIGIGAVGKTFVNLDQPAPIYRKFNALAQQVRPGDFILSGELKVRRPVIMIGGGTGEGSVVHAQVVNKVLSDGSLEILELTQGGFHTSRVDTSGKRFFPEKVVQNVKTSLPWDQGGMQNMSILRARTPAIGSAALTRFRRRIVVFEKLRLELVRKGISDADSYKLLAGTYKTQDLVSSGARELLVPFFRPAPQQKVTAQLALGEKALSVLEKNYKTYAHTIAVRHRAGLPFDKVIPRGVTGICSTAVTMSGLPIWGNKLPSQAAPVDALRSSRMKVVGHFRPGGGKSHSLAVQVLKVSPHMLRGAIGGSLAVGGYAAYKAVRNKMKGSQEKLSELTQDAQIKPYFRGMQSVKGHIRKVKKSLPQTTGGKVDFKQTALEAGAMTAGGAGALATIGSIGKSYVQYDNPAPVYGTFEPLSRKVQPGDYVLSANVNPKKFTNWFAALGTGEPNLVHAHVVNKVLPNGSVELLDFDQAGVHKTILDTTGRQNIPKKLWSALPGLSERHINQPRNVTVIRVDAASNKVALANYRRRMSAMESLRRSMVSEGVGEGASYRLMAQAFRSEKFFDHAIRELFVPFFRPSSKATVEAQVKMGQDALTDLEKNHLFYARQIAQRHKAGVKKAFVIPKHITGVCSTAATMSGYPVLGNKTPLQASPVDALRTPGVKVVGHYRPGAARGAKVPAIIPVLRASPHMVRGGFGALAGIGAYGAYRAVKGMPQKRSWHDQEKTAGALDTAKEEIKKTGIFLPALAGGALAAVATLPGTRKHFAWKLRKAIKGAEHSPAAEAAVKSKAKREAAAIYAKIKASGVNPRKARIVVAGSVGSGKSTLARELSTLTGGSHTNLDRATKPKSQAHWFRHGWDLEGYLGKNPIPKGGVYDQFNVVNKIDPKHYDVAVLLDPSVKELKKRTRKRGRGAWLTDFMDHKRVSKNLNEGFDVVGGKELPRVGEARIRVSTRRNPFDKGNTVLNKKLRQRGISTTRKDRYAKIDALVTGKTSKGGPIGRYVNYPKAFAVGGGPIVGAGAAQYMYHKGQQRERERKGSRSRKVVEKLAVNRPTRELAKLLGVSNPSDTAKLIEAYTRSGSTHPKRKQIWRLASELSLNAATPKLVGSGRRRKTYFHRPGAAHEEGGDILKPPKFKNIDMAQYLLSLKTHFKGAHKPKPGELVVRSTGDADLLHRARPKGAKLYRGNPPNTSEGSGILATPHPGVAAGYAMGDTAFGSATNAATGRVFEYGLSKGNRTITADAYNTTIGYSKTHGGPSGLLHPDTAKKIYLASDTAASNVDKLVANPYKKKMLKRLSRYNPSYETVIDASKKLPPSTEYSVRRTRTPSGEPAYALRKVSKESVKDPSTKKRKGSRGHKAKEKLAGLPAPLRKKLRRHLGSPWAWAHELNRSTPQELGLTQKEYARAVAHLKGRETSRVISATRKARAEGLDHAFRPNLKLPPEAAEKEVAKGIRTGQQFRQESRGVALRDLVRARRAAGKPWRLSRSERAARQKERMSEAADILKKPTYFSTLSPSKQIVEIRRYSDNPQMLKKLKPGVKGNKVVEDYLDAYLEKHLKAKDSK